MAGVNIGMFYSDPVYRRLAMEAQADTVGTESTVVNYGGDQPAQTAIDMIPSTSLAQTTTIAPGAVSMEPVYGVTPSEGLLKRAEQGLAANFGAVMQSIATGSPEPLKYAAAGAGMQTILGDRPTYTEAFVDGGMRTQTGGFQAGKSYAQLETGRIVEVNPEDTDIGNVRTLTAAQAARLSPMDYVGADPRKFGGTLGQVIQQLAAPPLMGVMFGKVAQSPAGTPVALGSVGFLSERIHDAMFDFQEQVDAGKPGYFAMTIGNRYSAYNANASWKDIKVAGMNLNEAQFQQLYGASRGYDYRNVDWQNSTGTDIKGPSLIGFTNQGGFTEAGEFMTPTGRVFDSLNTKQMRDYVSSLPNDPTTLARVSGVMAANAQRARSSYQRSLMEKNAARLAELAQGASRREYDMGLAMRTPEEIAYESWSGVSDDGGPTVGTSTVGGKEYTTVSGSSGERDSAPSGRRTDSRGNTTNVNVSDRSETYFAEGGRVGKAVGEMAGQPAQEGMGPVGFVNGRSPEQVTEADTVADDVEGTVPEGTFVISGASVERYGSERIRKLLVSALQEASRQGIDISATGSKIVDEESVSVAVSEGEVLVPPVLVRIIGLQKLEKINALGQDEVDQRLAENGQAETSAPVEGEAPVQASVEGGFVERQKKAKGDKVDPRRVLPVSNFKSYNTPDEGRNWMNFAENIGATLVGKREAMAKAFSYARNYAINNEAEDEFEDTMRHALLGGLYAGGPDDNIFQKAGSAIASGFADYKERSAIQAENIEPVDRLESVIDLNNNQYGRALRKAAGDEETFVRAVENLMDRLRKGEEAPRLKNEDGKEITLVLSTADGRAGGFVNRQRKAPGGKAEKYEPYKKGDKREGLFDYSLEMFRLKKRLGDNSANMPRKEAEEPNDPFGGQKEPYEFTGNMIVEFSDFLREELDFSKPDQRRTYLQLMNEAIYYGSPQAVDQWYYSVENHPLNDDMTDRNVDEHERVKKSSKNAKELYLAPSFLMT